MYFTLFVAISVGMKLRGNALEVVPTSLMSVAIIPSRIQLGLTTSWELPLFPLFQISVIARNSCRFTFDRSLSCRKMATTNCGDMNTFNMDHGYNEALIRGYRSGFLTENEYHHIAQCENIDGRTFPARRDYCRRCQAQPPGDRLR